VGLNFIIKETTKFKEKKLRHRVI